MRAVRTLGLGVVLIAGVLVTGASGAAPPTKSAKHHNHHIHGVVVEIDHAKDKKGHGAIKIRVHDHAKGQANVKGKGEHVVTVHVNHNTRFEKVVHTGKGNKGGTREVLAHFRDLEPGMHVRVKTDHGHHAEEVSILVERHDGKGKGKGKGKK